MTRVFVGGALVPPEVAWMNDKSAGSISFVSAAEKILAEGSLSSDTARHLRERVERIKQGKETILEDYDVNRIVLEAIY